MNTDLAYEYQQEQKARLMAFDQIDLSKEEGYLMRLALFSANLINLFPHISPNNHAKLFAQNLQFTALETADRGVSYLADIIKLEGSYQDFEIPSKPAIFCCFHLGSYRILATWLYRRGYNLSVLVRTQVYEHEKANILTFKEQLSELHHLYNEAEVIDAEQPTSVLKILRQIRAGYSLLVYLDANTGSGKNTGTPISFFDREIYVREGAPLLSYLSGVPIVPVVAYKQPDLSNVLHFGKPISPNQTISKEDFAKQTLQSIYDWFSPFLIKYPAQWEAWNYLHHSLKIITPPAVLPDLSKSVYHFNERRYMLLDFQDNPLLFDRYTYLYQEISIDLFGYLATNKTIDPLHTLGIDLLKELLENQILI